MPRLREEIERTSSPFNDIVARRVGERVDLDVEGATFATWHPRKRLTGYSWDALSAAALSRAAGPPRSVLLLGLGGGTVVRQLRALLPEVRVVAVEIDRSIVDLARRHMELDTLGAEVVVDDAYAYIEACGERFDVVIDDLFLTGPEDVERAGVPEGYVLEAMVRLLTPGGVTVANLITDAGHRAVRRAARRAFRDRFAAVRVIKPPRGLNEVLLGASELAQPRACRAYGAVFEEPTDREFWNQLSHRSLGEQL
jgi:spermidine synthase